MKRYGGLRSHQWPVCRRGFSLLEFLVLIGIFALALIIILHTASATRRQADLVTCQSNLKQIGLATLNYTADNRDYLPQWPESTQTAWRSGVNIFAFGSGWHLSSMDATAYYPPVDQKSNDLGSGLLCMNISGYLGKWSYGYSPTLAYMRNGFPNGSVIQYDTAYLPERWCPKPTGAYSAYALSLGSSYLYNPHWIYIEPKLYRAYLASHPRIAKLPGEPSEAPFITNWYQKLSDYPKYAVLACDLIEDVASVNHPRENGRAAWNLLYPDGSVETVVDEYVTLSLAGNPGNGATPPSGPGNPALGGDQGAVSGSREILDNYLDILETEADGRDPTRTNLYPNAPFTSTTNQNRPFAHREGGTRATLKGTDTSENIAIKYF